MRFQINPIFLKLLLLIKCSFKILFSFFIILMAQYSIKNKGVGNRKLRFLQVALPASDTALAFYWRKSGPWNCFCIGDTESPGRGNEQTEESRHGRPWVPCWKAIVFSFLNVESNLTPWKPNSCPEQEWVGGYVQGLGMSNARLQWRQNRPQGRGLIFFLGTLPCHVRARGINHDS